MINEAQIKDRLKLVKYPGFSRDIVSFGLVTEVRIQETEVTLDLSLTTADESIPRQLQTEIENVLKDVEGVSKVNCNIKVTAPVSAAMQTGGLKPNTVPGIKNIIAVASGKGGVGKSTVSANIALALSKQGYKTGLCDCDLYGPSIGLMFGSHERPFLDQDDRIVPIERFGLKLMSMGFLLADDSPAILRGPMVTRYTQQFLNHVAWGELDYLVLDLPPGTGDIQLTIVQTVALSGAVIVTTPQEVALIDARKAVAMFQKVNVPILGILENMSYFLCPSDGKRYNIFGLGGGKAEAEKLKVPFLGEIPIDIPTREAGDQGEPIVQRDVKSPVSQAFTQTAKQVAEVIKKM